MPRISPSFVARCMEVRVRIGLIIFAAGLLFAGSSVSADTTAVYKAKSKAIPITMTVEIADNGNMRYQMSTGRTYGLVLGGVDYFVDLGPRSPVVDRVDDLVAAQKETMAPFLQGFRQHDTTAFPQLVPTGNVTINGRTGQGFGYKSEEKGRSGTPVFLFDDHPKLANSGQATTRELSDSQAKKLLAGATVVISYDPDLAQLRSAMAQQFGTALRMLTGTIGEVPSTFAQMERLLQSGAPLSFGGMELQSVNHTQIVTKRFDLPAQPETLDQIRDRIKPLPAPPTASPAKP